MFLKKKYSHQNIVKVLTVKYSLCRLVHFRIIYMICFIMIDHESVLKAGKGAASFKYFVYCRVACGFTPGGTKV